jgi:hypothetical protein
MGARPSPLEKKVIPFPAGLWLGRKWSREELAEMILRAIVFGCRDQNPGRTRKSHAGLS